MAQRIATITRFERFTSPKPPALPEDTYWQGVVLVVGHGDLRVEDANACGQVLGAVVVRDDAAPDRKLDLNLVQRGGGCSPLAVNYSCETVSRALTLFMRTVSWTEKFGA